MYGSTPSTRTARTSSTTSPSTTSRTRSRRARREGLDVEGILRGHLPLRGAGRRPARRRTRRGRSCSPRGVGVPWALEAQRLLAEDWGVAADVWSVTSWNELRRDALACEEHNLLHPDEEPRVPYVTHGARRRARPGRRGQRLDARGARPDRAAGCPATGHVARHRRLRLLRHPAGRRAGSSTSTRSRSCSRCSPSWRRPARSTRRCPPRRSSKYKLDLPVSEALG